MKKLFAVLFALITAAACSAPSSNAPTPPAPAATTVATTISDADLIAREKDAWTALEKKDLAAFGAALDAGYTEVGGSGVYDKAGVLEFVKDLEVQNPTFSDWKVLRIDDDAVLVNYSVTAKSSYKGKEEPAGPYRASAAWVKRDGKWVGIYFQETLAKTAPSPSGAPPAATPATLPPKSSATLATAPATTGPDAAANEKIVWDALRRKDYDAFAGFLDDAAIEVEPDGVFDKLDR